MTTEQAVDIFKETLLHVDFLNLGRTINAFAEGYTWKTFDNSKWRPNKHTAIDEFQWLAENAENIFNALQYFKDNR